MTLQNCPHPYLPKLYDVSVEDDATTVIEEYLEGQVLGGTELSEKQFLSVVRDLCSVLEFIHEKGIIHRDIKPSNIILAADGHVRLIDFDAARMPKKDADQDTRRLGTRGYAPPEQYGFAQTDERTDVYALGMTLEQISGEMIRKLHYKRVIRKCTNLDPDKRYQSVKQVRQAFFCVKQKVLAGLLLVTLVACVWTYGMNQQDGKTKGVESETEELIVLPAPEDPHWNGETGIGYWGNVPESGTGDEMRYHYRLYKKDTALPPDPEVDQCCYESDHRTNGQGREDNTYAQNPFATKFEGNGFYYFEVCAAEMVSNILIVPM